MPFDGNNDDISFSPRAKSRGSRPATDPPGAGGPGMLTTLSTAYPRVSNDTPSENAFCCVAPGVRFSDFAILATGVFWRASVFLVREPHAL